MESNYTITLAMKNVIKLGILPVSYRESYAKVQ